MHGQKDDSGRRARGPQPSGRFDAVQYGHRDVEHHDIGVEPRGLIQKRLTVADCLDDMNMPFEVSSGGGEEVLVVIAQQNTREFHDPSSVTVRPPKGYWQK